MAAKTPFWEIKKTKMTRVVNGVTKHARRTEFYANLKGKNGRVVVSTECSPKKVTIKNAIEIVDPTGRYEVRDLSV